MSTPSYLAFLTATMVLILIPGPSVMLAIGVSLAHGFRTGMANVVGASGAVAVQMMVFGLGLTPVCFLQPSGSRLSAGPASPICSISGSSNVGVPVLHQRKSKASRYEATPTGRFGTALWYPR